MRNLVLVVGLILGVGGLIYVTRPEVSMKLGTPMKCVSPDGRFIKGLYGADDKPYFTLEITDAPEPPMKIIQKGAYLEYNPFKQAFNEACKTGKIGEE